MKRRRTTSTRIAAAIAAGVLLLTAAVVPASFAAAPNPSPGSATVDGATGDWSLSADFFADMTESGVAGRPVRAKLYLRYDCDAEVLYSLVLAQGGEQVRQDRPDEAYIRIDATGKLTEPSDGNDGTPPDFAWVNGDGTLADGFEGSGPLAPGSYTVRAHVLIADDSADGYAQMDTVGRDVPLVIDCGGVAPTQGTPTPTPTTPTPTPTPTPTGGVGPTTAPTGGVGPTTAPTGGVAPTTSARPAKTLPPTDTIDPAGPSGPGGVGLVLTLLGAGSFASLILTRGRRHQSVAVEETNERR